MAVTKEQVKEATAPAPAKAGMGRWLTLGAVALVVMGTSIGGTLYFLAPAEEQVTSDAGAAPEVKVALYHNLRPAFIVNYLVGNKPRYLQVDLTVMTRDAHVVEGVVTHTPVIRGEIIDLLSRQDYLALQTEDGRQMLREQVRALVDEVLARVGATAGVENVLLTSFVMQ